MFFIQNSQVIFGVHVKYLVQSARFFLLSQQHDMALLPSMFLISVSIGLLN